MSLTKLSLRELSEKLNKRKISKTELLNEYLNVALKGSCITFCSDSAFDAAERLDEKKKTEPVSIIEGLPFSLKDNIRTKGILTTCNSRILKTHVPTYDSYINKYLIKNGGILTAKNCMREFSVGSLEDSAFEMRNYTVWGGTDENINIGAFAVSTDIGLCDYACGIWSFKPNKEEMMSKDLLSGSPSLEKITFLTRKADDQGFLYSLFHKGYQEESIDFSESKVLLYDESGLSWYIKELFEKIGASVHSEPMGILEQGELIYDVLLSTEFFTSLQYLGLEDEDIEAFIKNRTENIGFEVKKLILKGSFLLSQNHLKLTNKIFDSQAAFIADINEYLHKYDYIAAPYVYDDKLSKASAIAGLSELTVPFADVIPFKVFTKPEREEKLLSLAVSLERLLS